MPPAFVISLDFELYWGVRDSKPLESYRANLLGVREVVPRLLELFSAYGVRATWATVGFVFFGSRDELLGHLPARRPGYADRRLSPYEDLDALGPDEEADPVRYGRSLVEMIAGDPTQEIGTHTFSHYYCLEEGQGHDEFEADLEAARRVAAERGIELTTIVFPRNQVNADYLRICARHGITAYRGTERARIYSPRPHASERLAFRGLRLADAYLPVAGSTAFTPGRPEPGLPVNVPSSRFLRPYDPRLRHLDGARLRRITADMSRAARTGGTYHLWWHPHNFGVHTGENLGFLARVLERFAQLREAEGMQSMAMREVARAVEGGA